MTETDAINPTTARLRAIDIHELLPQQEPFVMVGGLVRFDMTTAATQTTITPDNVMVDNGELSVAGVVENIAQTCAARIGYVNKCILKKGVQIGYIGAIRNFEVTRLPKVGQTITTRVDVVDEVFGMILAKAAVTLGGDTIATTEIKIAIRENDNGA